MKYILIFLLLISTSLFADSKYFTRTGQVTFVSATPLLELNAETNQARCFIDTKNGNIVIAMLIKSFKFKQALAEEHFNENYMESDTYPKAKFKGKIVDFSNIDLSQQTIHNVQVEGVLSIRGINKAIKTKASLEMKDGKIIAKTSFSVEVSDFKIAIPSLVADKVATTIPINVLLNLKPHKK